MSFQFSSWRILTIIENDDTTLMSFFDKQPANGTITLSVLAGNCVLNELKRFKPASIGIFIDAVTLVVDVQAVS